METEQHIYNHFLNDHVRVSVRVEKNSRGYTYEVNVTGAEGVQQAIDLLDDAMRELRVRYGESA